MNASFQNLSEHASSLYIHVLLNSPIYMATFEGPNLQKHLTSASSPRSGSMEKPWPDEAV